MPRHLKALIIFAVLPGLCFTLLVLLRAGGLLRPFRVPTGAMSPAVRPDDHIFTEGFSYRFGGKLERGDIIAFKTEKISDMSMAPAIFIKRTAGLPGERVRIQNGKLLINDQPVGLTNEAGGIRYANVARLISPAQTLTVPEGHYFVLGDTSTNSFDSRYWGFVPQEAVVGRAFICYWPPSRIGRIK